MTDGVVVMRDVSGRICVVLLDGEGKPFALAPMLDRVAADLRDGLNAMLGDGH